MSGDMTVIDLRPIIGQAVICDFCDEEFPEGDTRTGGILFSSYAVCSLCEAKTRKDAADMLESQFIVAQAGPGDTFRDFVLRIRKEMEGVR